MFPDKLFSSAAGSASVALSPFVTISCADWAEMPKWSPIFLNVAPDLRSSMAFAVRSALSMMAPVAFWVLFRGIHQALYIIYQGPALAGHQCVSDVSYLLTQQFYMVAIAENRSRA